MKSNSKSNIAKQGSILAIAALISRLIGFIYRVPLTDKIGDIGNSYYASAFIVYNFFLTISSYGIPLAMSKLISERYALKQYRNAHRVYKVSMLFCVLGGLISSIIIWFGASSIASFWKIPEMKYCLFVLSPTIFIVSIMSVYRGYFQGMKTMIPTGISQVVEQIFNAIFSVVFAYLLFNKGVEYAAAGGLVGTGIGALTGLIFLITTYIIVYKNKIKPRLIINRNSESEEAYKEIFKNLIYIIVPIILCSAIAVIINMVDTTMLMKGLSLLKYSEYKSSELYGIYQGKYILLTNLPIAIATAIATASVPSLATSVLVDTKKEVNEKINLVFRFTMLITIPASIGLMVLAKPILMLLFHNYPEGAKLLQFGSVSVIFFALIQITTGILQSIGKFYEPTKNFIYGLLIKVILNFIFIFILDINIYGLVVSTNIFAIIVAILNIRSIKNNLDIILHVKKFTMKVLFSAIIMGIACILVYKGIGLFMGNNFPAILAIILGVVVYMFTLLKNKVITKEEIVMLPKGNKLLKIVNKLGI